MAVAVADTNTRRADSRPPVDPSLANFIGLICAAAIIIAFLFVPWFWEEVKFNGSRLMSDALIDGTYKQFLTTEIVLVPLAALAAFVINVLGLGTPERGLRAAWLTAGIGLVGLYYYVHFYWIQDNELVDEYVTLANGFYIALVALIAMVAQLVFLLPPVNELLYHVNQRTLARASFLPRQMVPYLFLVVPLVLYTIWVLWPTAYSFYLSFTRWDGVSEEVWIGLDNYRDLFDDDRFRLALENNVRWLILFITVPTTMGLAMALIFNTEMRGGRWYKVSFYSPLVLSGPVIALVWSWVYHPKSGLVNSLLVDGGITDNPPGWLADREIAIYCIIIAAIWRQVGYVMVLYLAGLKNLDPTLIDAAMVDGTNRWQLFRHVIFPLLGPVTTIVLIISVIDSMRAFDLVQIMTRGNQDTEVLANMMYMEAFNNYRMGYGGAIAVVLFSISVFFVGIYLWRTLKTELEY